MGVAYYLQELAVGQLHLTWAIGALLVVIGVFGAWICSLQIRLAALEKKVGT